LYHREYSKSNREKRNATNQRRKAIKRGAEGNISSKEWELVLGFYGKCASCGSEENLTMDHVVPLSWGGGHNPENIQVLCGSCNSSKGCYSDTDYRTPEQIEEVTRLLEGQWA
jgi:5-methylcytosine-specific restriction endonuclease McrA